MTRVQRVQAEASPVFFSFKGILKFKLGVASKETVADNAHVRAFSVFGNPASLAFPFLFIYYLHNQFRARCVFYFNFYFCLCASQLRICKFCGNFLLLSASELIRLALLAPSNKNRKKKKTKSLARKKASIFC